MRIVDHTTTFKAHLQTRYQVITTALAKQTVDGIKSDMRRAGGGKRPPPGENPLYGWLRPRGKPGGAPAVQTGRLLRSISWLRLSPTKVRIGTDEKRGRWTQGGTPTSKKIVPKLSKYLSYRAPSGKLVHRLFVIRRPVKPRPWLSRAVSRLQYIVKEAFKI